MNKNMRTLLQAAARNRETLQLSQRSLIQASGLREARAAIFQASVLADPEPLRQLLDQGVPIDIRFGEAAYTPLHAAAGLGHMEVVSLLLERGPMRTRRTEMGKP